MSSIRKLAELIDKELRVSEHDISPRYTTNMRQKRILSDLCLQVIMKDSRVITQAMKNIPTLKGAEKTSNVMLELLSHINRDIKLNKRWTFWHYAGLCIVTSVPYANLIKEGKNKTINLQDQRNWVSPNHEVAILTINYLASTLFQNHMKIIINIVGQRDVSIQDVCKIVVDKIDKISGVSKNG